MTIDQTLQEIGLQEREIKVYLALLELGASTVLPIAQKSAIKRTYCYDILERLIEKQLVSYFEKNNRRRYAAEDPSKIEELLKLRLQHFSEILPELRSIHNQPGNKPRIRYYEGIEMAHAIARELANTKEFDAISSPDDLIKFLGDPVIEELPRKMAQKGVKSRELYSRGALPVSWMKYYNKPLQEIRYLPTGIKIANDILLYDNKLALISYSKEVHGIVIEGSNIVDAHKTLFDLLWQATPAIN